eukprot:1141305-Pelagomonas_calceolata.AAC.1
MPRLFHLMQPSVEPSRLVHSHAAPSPSLELDFLLEPLSFAPTTGDPQQVPAGMRIHPEAQRDLHRHRGRGPGNRPRTQVGAGLLH